MYYHGTFRRKCMIGRIRPLGHFLEPVIVVQPSWICAVCIAQPVSLGALTVFRLLTKTTLHERKANHSCISRVFFFFLFFFLLSTINSFGSIRISSSYNAPVHCRLLPSPLNTVGRTHLDVAPMTN